MSTTADMKTLTMGGKTYKFVDEQARADIESVKNNSNGTQGTDARLDGFEGESGSVKTYIDEGLGGKVDAVEGKGLSTNDFTDQHKNQIISNQQEIERVDLETGLKLDGFANEQGSVKAYVDEGLADKAPSEHDHEQYQPKGDYVTAEDGKGLSTNDFTDELKEQLVDSQQDIDEARARLSGFPVEDGSVKAYIDEGLSDKSDADHDHDGIYVKQDELNEGLAGKVDAKEGWGLTPNPLTDTGLEYLHLVPQLGIDNTNTQNRLDGIGNEQGSVKTYIDEGLAGKADSEHDHDGTYVKQTELDDVVNTALQTAKDSGEFDGKDGTNGTDGADGQDGADGKNGADGTSVTVTSVTESAESGGENVVKFSDGKTLTVKNGKDGADGADGQDGQNGADGKDGEDGQNGQDGYTPVAGVDYPTDAQFDAKIAAALANRNQLEPLIAESADWLNENGDSSKVYIVPNSDGQGGKVYAYAEVESEVTNTLAGAVCGTETQQINNWVKDKGYSTSSRLSSDGTAKSSTIHTSGFIPALPGDVLTVANITLASGVACYVVAYDATGATTGYQIIQNSGTAVSVAAEANTWCSSKTASGFTATLSTANFGADFTQIRISGVLDAATVSVKGMRNTAMWYAFTDFVATDDARLNALDDRVKVLEAGETSNIKTSDAALELIKEWDKPVYDTAPLTLLGADRQKPAMKASETDESNMSVEAVYAKYDELMAKHPYYITRHNIGEEYFPAGEQEIIYNNEGSTIPMYYYDFKERDGRAESGYAVNETKPKIIIMCGIHREYAGIYGIYYALEEIAENPEFADIRRNAHLIVIPCANPYGLTDNAKVTNDDGTEWTMTHVNANGIAPHNNFGVNFKAGGTVGAYNYGGAEAYSELETQYVDKVMSENKDAIAFLSTHNFNYGVKYASDFVWLSSATAHMCNLCYRLIEKLTTAWIEKYGETYKTNFDKYRADGTEAYPDGDYRIGRAVFSTSAGTEQLNATKYGILGANLEIGDRCRVLDGGATFSTGKEATYSSDTMTRGAEVYANYLRILLWNYDHHDREKYAPKPAYEFEQ